jgi:hypothetical protein
VHPSYLLRMPDAQKEAGYHALVADLVRAARFVQSDAEPPRA